MGGLNDEEAFLEVRALFEYLAKPGNRGAMFWLDGKDFSDAQLEAMADVIVALVCQQTQAEVWQ